MESFCLKFCSFVVEGVNLKFGEKMGKKLARKLKKWCCITSLRKIVNDEVKMKILLTDDEMQIYHR